MEKFEIASRKQYRFETSKGLVTTEDLWFLPLLSKNGGPCLDNIARALHKKLKESDTESFVVKAVKSDEDTQVKFDIVKHIIDVRLAEAEAAEQAKTRKEKKQRIMAIIAAKEDQALENLDVDALRKLMEEY